MIDIPKKSSLFNVDPASYKLWKSRKIFICSTPGMSLWIACHTMYPRPYNNETVKKAIKAYAHNVTDCRCRDCRYARIYCK